MDDLKFDTLFSLMYKCFWVLGMPFQSTKTCLRFYVMLVSIVIMVLGEAAYFSSIIGYPDRFLDVVALGACIASGVLAGSKIFILYLNRKKLFVLISRLKNIYSNLALNSVQIKEIKFVHKLINYYFILNLILISSFNFSIMIIIPMIYYKTNELVMVLAYPVLMPFAINTWLRWTVVYIFSVVCGFIVIVYITTVDNLFYLLTTQVCLNFSSLTEEIENFDTENENILLSSLIKKHQEVLQLAADLEEVFTGPNFYNTLIGALEICFIGFNLSTAAAGDMPRFILFLMQVLTEILMMSVFGEKLIQESLKVGEAAYYSLWYNMDEKDKKTVLLIIFRSHAPMKLTGYKFSIICHETFTKIISSSWSYFTILRQVYVPSVEIQNKLQN